MTIDLRGAAYAASRISSTLKGSTKQFGWLQATATKASSLSITSANLQPSEFVYRSRDSRKLRLNRDDREPGSGSWISSWATRLVWIWAPHKVTASNLIRATRDCWPKALKSSGVLRPPSSGRYTRRIQPSQASRCGGGWLLFVRVCLTI
jgi:hypothetical protein